MSRVIKTNDEIKKYLSVNTAVNIESIDPDLKDVELSIIKKHLGETLFNELITFYEGSGSGSASGSSSGSGSTANKLPELLVKVQEPLVCIAFAQGIDILDVNISDRGVTKDSEAAFQYQRNNAQRYLYKRGYNALESLIEFLEENKSTFDTWVESEAYSENRQFFINNTDLFSKYYNIGRSRLTFIALWPYMRIVEETAIKPVIGQDLFSEIKAQIYGESSSSGSASSSTISVSADNQYLLENFIYQALTLLTINRAIGDINLELTDKGFVISEIASGGANQQLIKTPSRDLMDQKKFNAEKIGQLFLDNLKEYLNANASAEKFKSYFESDLYTAPEAETEEENETQTTNDSIYGAL